MGYRILRPPLMEPHKLPRQLFDFPQFLSVPRKGHFPNLHQRGEDKQFLLVGAIEPKVLFQILSYLELEAPVLKVIYKLCFNAGTYSNAPRTANK